MHFDTHDIDPGYHAVSVIVEDYVLGQPLSKVSLLFLMEVGEESATCIKPNIIKPRECLMVHPGVAATLEIKAEPGDQSKQ